MRKILVVHPSRGRAERAIKVALDTKRKATTDILYYLSIDRDDVELEKYTSCKELSLLVSNNTSCILAINKAVKHLYNKDWDIIVVMSDDFELPDGWDKMILDATEGKEDWVLKTFDGIQQWIITFPIMDRKYYDRFNYVYHPDYKHMFCDTEMTAVGDLLKKTITRNDILFKHNHYSVSGGKDKINENNDKTFDAGAKLYIQRHYNNYGLSKSEITGEIKNKSHLNWIEQKRNCYTKSLSVLIPTLTSRKKQFDFLYEHLKEISKGYKVEILFLCDNKEMTIGDKRNRLLSMATGDYVCFIDDDDWVSDSYFKEVFDGIYKEADCCSLNGYIAIDNGTPVLFTHSLRYTKYEKIGNVYVRPPNHLNTIKSSIAKKYKFKSTNMGEDTDWAMRICNDGVLKTTHEISDVIYYYNYISKK